MNEIELLENALNRRGGKQNNTMTIKQRADRISKNARESMRDCALRWRVAKRKGDAEFSARWLGHAVDYRNIAKGILESA